MIIPQIFIRSLRSASWFMLPLLFTSYISPDIVAIEPPLNEGNYNLKVSGSQNLDLIGAVDYEAAVETTGTGKQISTLRLNLKDNQNGDTHSLGFLICKENSTKKIGRGTYRVSRKIDGFLNYFDGVFGFASIKALGEQPFFAESGSIVIANVRPTMLSGKIEVKLQNSEGKRLNIKGKFNAFQRIIE